MLLDDDVQLFQSEKCCVRVEVMGLFKFTLLHLPRFAIWSVVMVSPCSCLFLGKYGHWVSPFSTLARFLNDAFSCCNSGGMVTLVYSNAFGSFASWFVLKLRSAIKLNVLFGKKLDWHVVYWVDLLFKYNGLE